MNIRFPDEYPYHPHWKVSETHFAYWELAPTIDHIDPIAQGGCDKLENWATTSMMHNAVKSNWTLEQLQWRLYPEGDMKDWDGLTELFIDVVERDTGLLKDNEEMYRFYLIKEFERLKEKEREQAGWNAGR